MKKRNKRIVSLIKSFMNSYGLIIVIIIPIMILINWGMFFIVETEKNNIDVRQSDLAKQQFNTIDYIISSGIANTHNDLHVIRDAEEMTNYVANPTQTTLDNLEQLLFRIANNKSEFLSISIIDTSGNEIAKVNRNNNSLNIVSTSELSNISDEPIFDTIPLLSPLDLYISPITIIDDSEPSTKFALNVYDQDDVHLHLIINYNGNALLSIFSEYHSSNIDYINLALINNHQLWKIESTADGENVFVHSELPNDLYSDDVLTYNIQIEDRIDHNVFNDEDFFTLYANIDHQGAYNEYGSYLLKQPLTIYIINVVLFMGIFFLALIIKRKNENRLLLNANMYLSDKNKDGVMITDKEFRITYVNEAFTNIYGYKLSDIEGDLPYNIFTTHQFEIDPKIISSTNIFEKNIWNKSKAKVFILKHLRIRPETSASGINKHYIEIFSDPKLESKSLSNSLLNQDSRDLDLMVEAFNHLPFNSETACFMVLKLYNENNIKDSKNELSKTNNEYRFANYLRKNIDESFNIASPGFNYTIIYSQNKKIDICINALETLLEKYKQLPNINPRLEYHFGVSISDFQANSKKELFYQAILALEMTIKQKNTKHLIYQKSFKDTLDREKEIYAELENAFNHNEFYLNYQIQVDLTNNKHVGAEALLRWQNQTLGNVSPYEFIPVIENSFYVNRLSLVVVKLVIQDLKANIKHFNDDFRISINLTAFDFSNEYIIRDIVQTIEKNNINTKRFCFEMTESSYLTNKTKANELITYLQSKNIIVAIDDFGTGFSSIGALKDIQVDLVKIDRFFIKNYPENDDGLLFKSLTQLVNNLQIKILAEGVETDAQLKLAKENHCREVQGYYFSKPLPIEVFIKRYLNK